MDEKGGEDAATWDEYMTVEKTLVELTVGSCDLHRSVCVGRLITNLAKRTLFQIHIT